MYCMHGEGRFLFWAENLSSLCVSDRERSSPAKTWMTAATNWVSRRSAFPAQMRDVLSWVCERLIFLYLGPCVSMSGVYVFLFTSMHVSRSLCESLFTCEWGSFALFRMHAFDMNGCPQEEREPEALLEICRSAVKVRVQFWFASWVHSQTRAVEGSCLCSNWWWIRSFILSLHMIICLLYNV